MIDTHDIMRKSAAQKIAEDRHHRLCHAEKQACQQPLLQRSVLDTQTKTDRHRKGVHRQSDRNQYDLIHTHSFTTLLFSMDFYQFLCYSYIFASPMSAPLLHSPNGSPKSASPVAPLHPSDTSPARF